MTDRKAAKARTARLRRLREEHQATVERTRATLKEQQAFRRELRKAMEGGPKTVPQIADAARLPPDQVLWHVTALKKYDEVVETGMDGEYYQYQLASEMEA